MPRIQYTPEERVQIKKDLFKEFWSKGHFKPLCFSRIQRFEMLPPAEPPPSLEKVALQDKRMAQVDLHPITKSVLCGTIFGDSSMAKNNKYKNARVQNRHSSRQAEWFFWKWAVACDDCSNGLSSMTFQNPDGKQLDAPRKPGEKLGKLKITTTVYEPIMDLYKILCPSGYKEFGRSWLNHMNNYFLMTLWLDDGSLPNPKEPGKVRNQGVLCTEGFRVEQQKILKEYMKTVWGVNMTLRAASETEEAKEIRKVDAIPTPMRLHFSSPEDLRKFLLIIAPVLPVESMLYKLYFEPSNDVSELQRWASELESKVNPKFKGTVIAYYSNLINQML